MTTADTIWIRPGDADYDQARSGYNEIHPTRPALIAPVRSVSDVEEALAYARSAALPVAVKGGGHSIGGLGGVDGGVVIDVRGMSAIEPAEQAGEFWVGGGALAGAVATQLGQRGLVVPLGDSAAVGIAGLTLGGGIGWLTRKLGLTLDSLVAAEIVTADGSVSVVDSVEHPGLFWALRGGGGNFGVVTRLRFRPHPLGQVLGGELRLPLTETVLADFLAYAAAAPDEFGAIAIAMRPPDGSRETAVLLLRLVWSGDLAAGASVFARLRALAEPISEDLRARPYHDMYELTAQDPASITNATESLFADALDGDAVTAIVEAANAPAERGAFSGIELRALGGAMATVPAAATAFAHRGRKWLVSAVRAGFPRPHYAANSAWVRAVRQRLHRAETGRYLNFIEQPGPADVAAVYPGETAARLAAVKRAVDPDNLFSRNLNLLQGASP
jgi:FAD/FMN-containing dehydrogenase